MGPGAGQIKINARPIDEYFGRDILKMVAEQPLALTNTQGQFDFYILASGGGIAGQAGAVRHGIAKVLQTYDPNYRGVLKKAGLLTRDAREKERKKYGQKGARARYQYSKR
jgi:small subunit ribosomal protein S9